jgi:hypothetical protein
MEIKGAPLFNHPEAICLSLVSSYIEIEGVPAAAFAVQRSSYQSWKANHKWYWGHPPDDYGLLFHFFVLFFFLFSHLRL